MPGRMIINRDHLHGAAIGAILAAGAILMPYSVIVEAISRGVTVEYLVAMGLVSAAAVVPFVRRKRLGSTRELSFRPSTEGILQQKPTQWLEGHGLLSVASDITSNVEHLEKIMATGFRKGVETGWRTLLLRAIAAHGRNELVHGQRTTQILAEFRKVAEDAPDDGLEAGLDRLAKVYDAVTPGCPQTLAFVKDLGKRHATMETAFLAALEFARTNRPLPTSLFTWVKLVDRPLWYALNNLGRTTFHVEGVAAIAHYRAEVAVGRALTSPHVQAAALPLARLASELTAPVGREAA